MKALCIKFSTLLLFAWCYPHYGEKEAMLISNSGVHTLLTEGTPQVSRQDAIHKVLNQVKIRPDSIVLNHPSYSIHFTKNGIQVAPSSGAPDWSWQNSVSFQAKPTYRNDSVQYDYGDWTELYLIKENSIEQQFVLKRPLTVKDEVVRFSGQILSNGEFSKTASGWHWFNANGEVTLGNVFAFDACQRSIPAVMKVSGDKSVIEIQESDLEEVTYPVTIDPEIGTNDFRISTTGPDGDGTNYNASSAAVAHCVTNDAVNYPGGIYLVVWNASNSGKAEIYAQRINGATGAFIGSEIRVSFMGVPNSDVNYDASSPDVVASATEFFIVWHADDNTGSLVDNENEIYGQRLDPINGTLLGSRVRISTTNADGNATFDATAPAVAYSTTTNRYLVTWYSDHIADNQFEIFSQGVQADATLVGSNVRISNMGSDPNSLYDAFNPDVAWNSTNNQYMVAWTGDIDAIGDAQNEVFIRRVEGSTTNYGNTIGSTVLISDMGPAASTLYSASDAAIKYNVTNNNYLVVWAGDDNTSPLIDDEFEIFGQFVGNFGAVGNVNGFFRISDMGPNGSISYGASAPAIDFDPNLNQFLITWHGDDNNGGLINDEFEVFGQLIRNTGVFEGSKFRLSDAGGTGNTTYNATFPAISYNSSYRDFLIAWQGDDNSTTTIDNEFEIWGQRFAGLSPEPTAQPTLSATPFTAITPTSYTVTFIAATGTPDGYFVLREPGSSSPTGFPSDHTVYQVNNTTGNGTGTVAFAGSAITFNESGLNPGTTYRYAFFSYNGVNSSTNYLITSPSTGNVTTYSLEPTAHAASFTATQAGTNQINLSFSAASTITNAAGYIILRRQDGSNPTASGIADGAAAPSTPVAGTTLLTTITNTSTTSFNDTGLTPGVQYNYAIIPYGYNGSNALTYNFRTAATIPTATATTLSLEPAAHAATFTAVSSGTAQINLTFSAASTITNAAGYIILRRQDGTNPTATGIADGAVAPGTPTTGTTLVTTINNTATTTFNDAVSSGTQYNYAIIPYGYNGSSALSYNFRTAATIPTANATTLSLEPLAHPASFTAATGGSTQINLTFSAASTITNAAGYIILRRQDLSNPTNAGIADATATSATPTAGTTLVTTITNTATTSFNDTGVNPGVQYNYTIFPYGYNGSNALTYNYLLTTGMSANAFTLSTEPAAHAATFTATASGTTQINLSFSAASTITNAAGYIILRRQDGTNPTATGIADGAVAPGTPTTGTTLVTTIANTATTTFNDVVSSGTQYNYAIIPYGYNGSNAQTYNYRTAATVPTANATTLSLEPLAHPASFAAATGGSNQINLTFSAASTITNAAGYIILRRQDLSNPTNTGIADATATAGTPTAGTTLVTTITSTATTSFNDTGVSPGIQYNYTIFPYGYNGTNALSYNYLLTTAKNANAFTLSAEPTAHAASFTATQAGTNQINLAFSAASTLTNAAGYIILRRQDGTNPTAAGITDGATAPGTPAAGTTLITTITNTATTTFNDAVSVGTQYNYAIIPYGYNGSNTQTYNFRTAATVPVATATSLSLEPVSHAASFTAVQGGTTQINLTFSAASTITNAMGYIILRRADGSNPTSAGVADAATTPATPTAGTTLVTTITNTSSTTFNDVGLASCTQYNYIIVPYGYNGTNALSYNYLIAATIPSANATTLPDTPAILDADPINVNGFTAHWQTVDRAVSYEIDVSLLVNFSTHVSGYPQNVGNLSEWQVDGLDANTSYHYKVRAFNAAGGASAFSNVKSLQTLVDPGGNQLVIDNIVFSNLASSQNSVHISADVTGGSGAKTVQLFHKKITSTSPHAALSMSNTLEEPDTYEIDLQGAANFDDLGVEFFIRASDASPGSPEESDLDYIYRSFAAGTAQAISSIVLSGGRKDTYQMISIPFELSDDGITGIFGDELGDYDKTKWRLVRWQSSSETYGDPPSFNDKIELGKSYWFNSIDEVTVKPPAGTTPNYHQGLDFVMELEQGWNQISTPYPFAIDWDDVLVENGIDPLTIPYKIFNAEELGFIEENSMEPYKGGFVFVDNSITLDIPVVLKNSANGRKSKGELSKDIDFEKWLLPFTLVQGDIKNTQGGIGMHPQANTSKDQWDDVTVPRFIQYLEINFYHPEFFWPKFARDVVPTTEEHEWALSVESNGQGSIELQWDAQAITNAHANLFLYDEAEGRLVDMKVQSSFTIPERSRKDLKIIYTHKDEYIPNHTMLGKAWPNPASTEVNIPVILAGTAPTYNVEVDVYDLKGVKQKSVGVGEYNAGIHSALWDIKDAHGNDVTSGVYIVKLKVNGRYLPEFSKVIVNRSR